MSTYQLGFIGTGNMGGALAQAAAKSGAGMLLSNRTADKAVRLAAELGCAAGTNLEVAEGCKYIFLGVKPQMLQALLAELKAPLSARTDRPVLVSMAASVTIRTIRETLGLPCPVVRIMPNLPVALGKGVVLISPDDTVTEDELTALEEALKPAGLLMRMPEDKLDAGSAVSGCGPAFVAMFIEALGDAAVKHGVARADAYRMVSQMIVGTGKLQLASGQHPGAMKDAVCSPGGTTIAGVAELERKGFRGAVIDAIDAVQRKKPV